MAIDALDADAATKHIVLISKPPDETVAKLVLERVAQSPKTFTVCFSARMICSCRQTRGPPRP